MLKKLRNIFSKNSVVCTIYGDRNGKRTVSNGVFVDSQHVLTANHCIADKSNLYFLNSLQQSAQIASNGDVKLHLGLDMALVRLTHPIGSRSMINYQSSHSYQDRRINGYLMSRFMNAPVESHPLHLAALQEKGGDTFAVFKVHSMQVGHGFSGSPVFDDNDNLISLATTILRSEGFNPELTGQYTENGSEFMGPKPSDFSSFMCSALLS